MGDVAMQQVWLALIGGLVLGWLIEWIIDWQFWRRNLNVLREENQALQRQLAEAHAQLAATQAPPPAATPPVASGEAVETPLAEVPEAPTEASDAARSEEANTLGVTAAPADPQTEGE
jgi:hypothetical protein